MVEELGASEVTFLYYLLCFSFGLCKSGESVEVDWTSWGGGEWAYVEEGLDTLAVLRRLGLL